MEIDVLVDRLSKEIIAFRNSELFKTKPLRQDILSVQIALSLFELSILSGRQITTEEMHWFKGGYYISMDMTGEWIIIAELYDTMVKTAAQKGLIKQ